MKINKNFFIFEGLDGSGKTTQAQMLFDCLSTHKEITQPVYRFREPGGTFEAELIRDVLKGSDNLTKEQQLLLFCLSRRLLMEKIHKIIMNDPTSIIIFDRFLPSTYAYQKYANGMDETTFNNYLNLSLYAQQVQKNACTFYIRITPEECMRRIEARGEKKDRYENLDYLKKVFSGYEDYFQQNLSDDTNILNGNYSIGHINRLILDIVQNYAQE